MIGRLRGTLVHKQAPQLLLDVGGVGYEVEATLGTFHTLPPVGSECTLYTHLVVREDAHLLFGFASPTERGLFRDLIRINGIGARMALGILSGMTVEMFIRCVRDGDAPALTRLPGVGKKSAERLIVEMRDRFKEQGGIPGAVVAATIAGAGPDDPIHDAVSALAALGYKPHEASRMVRAIDVAGKNSEEIIRSALQAAVR
jgi:holliday junction DNA helicase RuvA